MLVRGKNGAHYLLIVGATFDIFYDLIDFAL